LDAERGLKKFAQLRLLEGDPLVRARRIGLMSVWFWDLTVARKALPGSY
jgi:hypothetical protein